MKPIPIEESSDTALDEALKLLEVEEPERSFAPEQPVPIEESLEPKPLEIPEVEEAIPIEVPEPIPIEEIEPIPIEEPQPIPIEEPEPIAIEEPQPIPIEEAKPIPVETLEPIPVEQPEPSKEQFVPFQPEIKSSPDELSLEEIKPIEIPDETIELDLPSPESILQGESKPEIAGKTEEERSIFGIPVAQEKGGFTPFTAQETESMKAASAAHAPQASSASEAIEATDLFTALSQKKKEAPARKAPRFIPFIPTAEGEYEDIALEAVIKDEKEIETTKMIKCPGCGREIPADWKFCTYCGTLLK